MIEITTAQCVFTLLHPQHIQRIDVHAPHQIDGLWYVDISIGVGERWVTLRVVDEMADEATRLARREAARISLEVSKFNAETGGKANEQIAEQLAEIRRILPRR